MTYYLKPAQPIEAYQWNGTIPFTPAEGFDPLITYTEDTINNQNIYYLSTREGSMLLIENCYILKGVEGEYWVVQESIFNKSYVEYIPIA